jgi:uncharacterized protein YciU (UPF0263 family)
MRRRTALTLLAQTPLLLAGCSSSDDETATPTDEPTETPTETATETPTETETPTQTPEPEFDASTSAPIGGVQGEPVPIDVTVTNTGDGSGEFEATVSSDGSELSSGSVEIAADATETLTFEPTFSTTGKVDVEVAGTPMSLEIFEHPLEFVHAAMQAVDTLVIDEELRERGRIDLGEGPTDWQKDTAATIEKNFEAETFHKKSEDDLVYGTTPLEETIEQWVVDGVFYEKQTKHTEGVVEYNKRFSEKPNVSTVLDIHGTPTEGFLSFPHTAEEYVFVFDPSTTQEATALAERTIGPGGFLPAENATDARLELRYDRGTGRATTVESELTLEGGDVFPELDRSTSQEYGSYGDAVEVSVPDEVKSNAN